MTPIFIPLWFGWALKTAHQGGHFALFPRDCRNSQTRWRRGADLNSRDPPAFETAQSFALEIDKSRTCPLGAIRFVHSRRSS
jgi:hypothetical protein